MIAIREQLLQQCYYLFGILDNGKIGIIINVMKSGSLRTTSSIINWRENYEIYYFDGQATVIGTEAVRRLIREGKIVVIADDKTI